MHVVKGKKDGGVCKKPEIKKGGQNVQERQKNLSRNFGHAQRVSLRNFSLATKKRQQTGEPA